MGKIINNKQMRRAILGLLSASLTLCALTQTQSVLAQGVPDIGKVLSGDIQHIAIPGT